MVSTRPEVLTIGPFERRGLTTAFIGTAVAAGTTDLEVYDDDLVDTLPLTVEPITRLALSVPDKLVLGGTAAVGVGKFGAGGASLLGRGGVSLVTSAGLTLAPADLSVPGCLTSPVPDFMVTANAVGTFTLEATVALALGQAMVEVVVPVAVTTVDAVTSPWAATEGGPGFAAELIFWAGDAVGAGVAGVECEWRTSRPVELSRHACGLAIRSSTAEPVELTCWFDGRDLGTVTVSR